MQEDKQCSFNHQTKEEKRNAQRNSYVGYYVRTSGNRQVLMHKRWQLNGIKSTNTGKVATKRIEKDTPKCQEKTQEGWHVENQTTGQVNAELRHR